MPSILRCETPEGFIVGHAQYLVFQQHGLNARGSCYGLRHAFIFHKEHFYQTGDLYCSACAGSAHQPAHQHTRDSILAFTHRLVMLTVRLTMSAGQGGPAYGSTTGVYTIPGKNGAAEGQGLGVSCQMVHFGSMLAV